MQLGTIEDITGMPHVNLGTIMRWTLKQEGLRPLLIRITLLTALWPMVAFVFATEFYLSARGMPLTISWTDAVRGAFRDWYPWMLLSPEAVILAERFRFDRGTWRRALVIHLAACGLFTIAYEGLRFVAYPSPFVLSTGGVDGPPGLRGSGGSVQALGPPPLPFPGNPSAIFFEGSSLHGRVGPAAVDPGEPSPLTPPTSLVRGFGTFPVPIINKWTQFLRLATMRTQFTIPIYFCIVFICWAIAHLQESGDRERRTLELETRLTQANLQSLKMQLQPHFLFNTLNAISSLIHENPKVADDMIGSLSQFLRTTLDMSSRNEIALRAELEFVDRYLEIQQIRFGDRLRIRREVDAEAMGALVPPLILQPLVENAIRHGIESRETGGTVVIRASRDRDVLHLDISDDGEGFSGGQLLGNGVGIANTKARLQELYGDNHQFTLIANQPKGACTKIEIPFRSSIRAEA